MTDADGTGVWSTIKHVATKTYQLAQAINVLRNAPDLFGIYADQLNPAIRSVSYSLDVNGVPHGDRHARQVGLDPTSTRNDIDTYLIVTSIFYAAPPVNVDQTSYTRVDVHNIEIRWRYFGNHRANVGTYFSVTVPTRPPTWP